MAKSFNTFVGNGLTKQFTFDFHYLDSSHVEVTVDGIPVDFTFLNQNTVVLSSTPPNQAVVVIGRETPIDEAVIDFKDGSILGESDLDNNTLQVLFALQEAYDSFKGVFVVDSTDNAYDAGGSRIKNLAAGGQPGDAVNVAQLGTYLTDCQSAQADAATSRASASGSATAAAASASQAAASASSAAAASIQNNLCCKVRVTNSPGVSASGAALKVYPNAKEYDPNSWFNTSTGKFQPTVPGWYEIRVRVGIYNTITLSTSQAFICKNGDQSNWAGTSLIPDYNLAETTEAVYLNGSTDYVEMYALFDFTGVCTFTNATYANTFTAKRVA